ncbi:MAG: tRNA threonylcarbamoyladenosine dehydratase [Bacteroidales bacterium]|nr:tRNA threonylcarbamoyladenosine dehydratase [Bacteroidales bacterium]
MAWTERTELLVGPEGLGRLRAAAVAVVGCGGVGAAAAEMLARASVGHIALIDSDCIAESNINRQLPALHSTVGLSKADVLVGRLKDINPDLDILTVNDFLTEENVAEIIGSLFPGMDLYVVDAIDTLSPKIALIQYCLSKGVPMVSSMGAGAKFDATAVRVADISKTYECPLAHMLRKRLGRLGIRTGFQAVFSTEVPKKEAMILEPSRNKKSQVGTISYLPTVFGCVCAQTAIKHIVGIG